MSLRLRLTLTYGLLLAVIVAVFGTVLFASMEQALRVEMDRRLQVRASQVELTIWPGAHSLTVEDISAASLDLSPLDALNAPSLYVQVLGRDGSIVAHSANLEQDRLPVDTAGLHRALDGERALGDVYADNGLQVRILSVPISVRGGVVGVLQVGQSRQPLRDTMQGLGVLLLFIGGVAILVAAAVSWLVAHGALGPLRTMSQRAAAIATEGNFHRRVGPVAQKDEIGGLAATVDNLLETVEATLLKHREFVADTSHELRNPLLAIQANLELLERVEDPEARAECATEAAEQVQRMSRLVRDLLLLAHTEAGQVIERRPLALGSVVERAAQEARHRADGRRVEIGPCEPVHLQADEGRLSQMLTNLVDNAVQHTGPDGRISLSLAREDGWARIRVTDDGEGIAPQHLAHVFERFYRASGTPSGAGGTGLGLAIVKHLAEAHGGKVTVESEPGGGTTFTVWLPLDGRTGTSPAPRAAGASESR
ncbi:MAG: HAMP domain-containing histidine kinase [Chloroflexi bacterium]|nr:HAMP domain-containing histidine kinase [Chloroflexota bacterium]